MLPHALLASLGGLFAILYRRAADFQHSLPIVLDLPNRILFAIEGAQKFKANGTGADAWEIRFYFYAYIKFLKAVAM